MSRYSIDFNAAALDEQGSQSSSDDALNVDQDIDDDPGALTSQTLNPDGTPKRPMNAFMIFARRRRPQVSAENQAMRTGDVSKILSREWNSMGAAEKQFYLDQAKLLKDNFNNKYPDYVYRRRPNNSRRRRKADPLHHHHTPPVASSSIDAFDSPSQFDLADDLPHDTTSPADEDPLAPFLQSYASYSSASHSHSHSHSHLSSGAGSSPASSASYRTPNHALHPYAYLPPPPGSASSSSSGSAVSSALSSSTSSSQLFPTLSAPFYPGGLSSTSPTSPTSTSTSVATLGGSASAPPTASGPPPALYAINTAPPPRPASSFGTARAYTPGYDSPVYAQHHQPSSHHQHQQHQQQAQRNSPVYAQHPPPPHHRDSYAAQQQQQQQQPQQRDSGPYTLRDVYHSRDTPSAYGHSQREGYQPSHQHSHQQQQRTDSPFGTRRDSPPGTGGAYRHQRESPVSAPAYTPYPGQQQQQQQQRGSPIYGQASHQQPSQCQQQPHSQQQTSAPPGGAFRIGLPSLAQFASYGSNAGPGADSPRRY